MKQHGHRDCHTKRSEKERQISYAMTYMWNLKCDTNEPIHKTETDSQTSRTDFWLPRGSCSGGGVEWEFGVSRCKLLYRKQISNKVLCVAQGAIFNILRKTVTEKNMFKCTYICLTESLCCTVEIKLLHKCTHFTL